MQNKIVVTQDFLLITVTTYLLILSECFKFENDYIYICFQNVFFFFFLDFFLRFAVLELNKKLFYGMTSDMSKEQMAGRTVTNSVITSWICSVDGETSPKLWTSSGQTAHISMAMCPSKKRVFGTDLILFLRARVPAETEKRPGKTVPSQPW